MKFNNKTLRAAVKELLNDAVSAEAKYGHISSWDTSEVTDMSFLFSEAGSFNQPIEKWDVSSVINMSSMFYWAETFNRPIGNWDVSNVSDMSGMFDNAKNFDQPIGNWDVSNVSDMNNMFVCAEAFDQPIGNWDVSNVIDMSGMFFGAESFNQPIGNWDVSSVTNMNEMFSSAEAFNQPIGNWDVSNVSDMSDMFEDAVSFNQDIDNWVKKGVSSVMDDIQEDMYKEEEEYKDQTLLIKSNFELRDKINEFLSYAEGEISIKNFEIDIDKDQSRWCSRRSYLIGDYEGYKYYCKVVVEKKREEIYDSNESGIGNYFKDLANGKSLSGIKEVNSFLEKLNDSEIHELLYPRFENENFYLESKAIEDGTPDEILSKFNEDEDFFSDNVKNFVFWNDDLKHYAYYKGRNLFQKDWSVVNLIKFNLKSSNIALQINWVFNNKISGNAGEFLRDKYFWERYNFSPKLNLLFTFNLCDSIASILYGFLLEKGSVMQIMISYVAWKNSISLLLKGEKNNDFNNYLAEACHYLVFNSNGFGDHKDDIIESRINAIKDINFNKELDINLKLNLYLCLYTNAALKFIDENKDYGSVSGDKIRDLKSLSTKLLNHLHKADELFKVLS